MLQTKCNEMAQLADREVEERKKQSIMNQQNQKEIKVLRSVTLELEQKNQRLQEESFSMQSTLTQFMNERDELNKTIKNQQKLIDTQSQNIVNFQEMLTSTGFTQHTEYRKKKDDEERALSDEIAKLREEVTKLKNEKKNMQQQLKKEVENRKTWQDMSRKKDEELNLYRDQVFKANEELDLEKRAHEKTAKSLQLKTERVRILEKQNKEKRESPTRRATNPTFEQQTHTVTEDEISQNKQEVIDKMKNTDSVPFPEKQHDLSSLSRIEQLKARNQSLQNKKKVMFSQDIDEEIE